MGSPIPVPPPDRCLSLECLLPTLTPLSRCSPAQCPQGHQNLPQAPHVQPAWGPWVLVSNACLSFLLHLEVSEDDLGRWGGRAGLSGRL